MAKIGLFDMDGTLFDYEAQIRKDMNALMSPNEGPCLDFHDDSKPWLKARMDLIKSQPGWWRNLTKLKLGWEVYDLAKLIGFDIQIITKGPNSKRQAWQEKAECIDHHFGNAVTINIVGKDKSNYYGHFLCEDYIPYLDGWLKHRPRGLGILIANPSNAGYEHPNVIRYDGTNIGDISRYLVAVSKKEDGKHWKDYL